MFKKSPLRRCREAAGTSTEQFPLIANGYVTKIFTSDFIKPRVVVIPVNCHIPTFSSNLSHSWPYLGPRK